MRGDGGKNAAAKIALFSSLVEAVEIEPYRFVIWRVGMGDGLPSEGSALRYSFAIQISSLLMSSGQSNQWSRLDFLIASEDLLRCTPRRCCS